MQAEGAGEKPRYKNTLTGFLTIGRTEGIRGLYKVFHASISVTCSQRIHVAAYSRSLPSGNRAHDAARVHIVGSHDVFL
jgi:hypothetical protein